MHALNPYLPPLSLLCLLPEGSLLTLPESASSSLSPYNDSIDKFDITPPTGWVFGEGKVSGNSGFSGASGECRV